MDDERRIQRYLTRRRNAVARRYPLFAAEFAAEYTPERARQHFEEMAELNRRAAEMFARGREQALQRGDMYREIARRQLPADIYDRHEQQWHWFEQRRGWTRERHAAYYADHWLQALRGTPWMHEHCPNTPYHFTMAGQHCPLCYRWFPPREGPRQLALPISVDL